MWSIRSSARRQSCGSTGSRPPSLSAWLTVCSCLLALAAGCGGSEEAKPEPQLPRDLAQELARRSDSVAESLARGDACTADRHAESLRQRARERVGRIPSELQEELLAAVNSLAERISCTPPPLPEPVDDDEDDDRDKGKGKDKDKGKKDKDKNEESSEDGETEAETQEEVTIPTETFETTTAETHTQTETTG